MSLPKNEAKLKGKKIILMPLAAINIHTYSPPPHSTISQYIPE
ncbi:MAG: hypothetical protein Q4P17_02630 [Methanobacterium sp.]|nr:hypothetical protein [Methanobacterium sp.]